MTKRDGRDQELLELDRSARFLSKEFRVLIKGVRA